MDSQRQLFSTSERILLKRVLFIDPGYTGTGWAFYPIVNRHGDRYYPECSGVIRCKAKGHWTIRAKDICSQLAGACARLNPHRLVIEMTELWSSGKSHASASTKRGECGDLFKLCYLVGGMGQVAASYTSCKIILVRPVEWKGQLPKNVVINRFMRAFPEYNKGKKPRDHEADALGMGLAAQGGL